jgi:phage baseplate assembly protein W
MLLTDLFLTRRSLSSLTSPRLAVDLHQPGGDLRLTRGRANLAQAILNRLFTRQGELGALGHPEYGSRLYQLIGQPNTRRTHALADLYIRESLAQEERIAEVVDITITPPSLRADQRNVLEMRITVRPIVTPETGPRPEGTRPDPTNEAGVPTGADGAAPDDLLTLSLAMNLDG